MSRVLDLATEGDEPGSRGDWSRHIRQPENYEVTLQKDPGQDELSAAEVEVLDKVFREYGAKSRWELVDLTHKLLEWQDPQGRAIPSTYRDILKVGGKSELEIATIEDELEGLAVA